MNQQTEPARMPITPPSVETKGIWQIMWEVFASPADAFDSFKRKPTIITPLVVVMVLGAVIGVFMAPYSSQVQIDLLRGSPVIPDQVFAQMEADAANPNLTGAALGGGFALALISAIAALLAMFLGKVIFGGDAKFMAIWGVSLLGTLIEMLGGLLRLPMVFAKESIYVSYGPAALLPGKDFTSIIYSLFYYCDVFWIWSVIVTGIGYAAIFGISRAKGYTTAASIAFLAVMVMIAASAIGLGFAGVDVTFF
ncbi:MAG: YIP1 family protein [Candidatus Zixiibacteriota bacterium]